MKIIDSILLGLLIAVACSCGNNTIDVSYTVYGSDSIKNMDLNPSLSNKEYYVSDILDSVKIVCLETNDRSVLSTVFGIILSEDRIFVKDLYQGAGIAIFDSNGRFIKRLARGNGPGEFPFCNDFAYDIESEELLVLLVNKIIRFDKDGNYKGDIDFDFPCTVLLSCNKGGYILGNTYGIESDIPTFSNYSTLVADRNFGLKQLLLPFSASNKVFPAANKSFDYNSSTVISVPFCDTIYKLKNDSLRPYIVLDFSSEKRDITQYETMQEYTENVLMTGDESEAVYMGDFFENATHQIIVLRYGNTLSPVYINKSNSHYISGYDCMVDLTEALVISSTAGVHNDWFYEVKNASSFPHNTITSSRYISKEDLAKLEQLKDDSNPFIMFYKLKDF